MLTFTFKCKQVNILSIYALTGFLMIMRSPYLTQVSFYFYTKPEIFPTVVTREEKQMKDIK